MLLYGKEIAEKIITEIRAEVEATSLKPRLGIVFVGDYKPSQVYVNKKVEAAKRAGISTEIFQLNDSITEGELLALIERLNKDRKIDGFIVQLPLPKHIDVNRVIEAIDPRKDVDGFHPSNMGKVFLDLSDEMFAPATPSGIMRMIEHYKIPVAGANAVVVGRSNVVGKPIALMLLQKDATVTICHSKTRNLAEHTKQADILVVAAGQPYMIKPEMVKEGAYVIDVGTTRITETRNGGQETSRVVGDVDPEVQKKAHTSPVPGGVGPLTVAMLLQNTLKAAKMRKNRKERPHRGNENKENRPGMD